MSLFSGQAKVGRRDDRVLTGPEGISGDGYDASEQWILYEINAPSLWTMKFPSTKVQLPEFVLPPPTHPSSFVVHVEGAVRARNTSTTELSSQMVTVKLWDEDPGFWDGDDLLSNDTFEVGHYHDGFAWDGLLIPYAHDFAVGNYGFGISGNAGNSGENPADVYQEVIEPGWPANKKSTTKSIFIDENES